MDFKVIASVLATLFVLIAVTASGETTTTDSGNAGGSSSSKEASQDEPESDLTLSQENAIESANSYLEMTGMSKKGLIEQLSSDAGEGYPKKDAKFAANYVDVNWNAEAVESAESYLETTSFSCDGLIEQLSSSAGEKFTVKQATYAAKKVGLC